MKPGDFVGVRKLALHLVAVSCANHLDSTRLDRLVLGEVTALVDNGTGKDRRGHLGDMMRDFVGDRRELSDMRPDQIALGAQVMSDEIRKWARWDPALTERFKHWPEGWRDHLLPAATQEETG